MISNGYLHRDILQTIALFASEGIREALRGANQVTDQKRIHAMLGPPDFRAASLISAISICRRNFR